MLSFLSALAKQIVEKMKEINKEKFTIIGISEKITYVNMAGIGLFKEVGSPFN